MFSWEHSLNACAKCPFFPVHLIKISYLINYTLVSLIPSFCGENSALPSGFTKIIFHVVKFKYFNNEHLIVRYSVLRMFVIQGKIIKTQTAYFMSFILSYLLLQKVITLELSRACRFEGG